MASRHHDATASRLPGAAPPVPLMATARDAEIEAALARQLDADIARDRRAVLRTAALRQSAVEAQGLEMVRMATDRARLLEWQATAEAIEAEARDKLEQARAARRRAHLDEVYRTAYAREMQAIEAQYPRRRRGGGILAAFLAGLVAGLFGG